MNIFGKFTIHHPDADSLIIHRQPGAVFWLFMLMYCGVAAFITALFALMLWETYLPRTLTCRQQNQTITCNYVIPGLLNRKTIEIENVNRAIASQKETGETLVLTSSRPWVNLGTTSNNAQNIQWINQGLARLEAGEPIWKLDLYADEKEREFLLFFLLPVGFFLLLVGFGIIFMHGSTTLELDARANTVSIIRLGKVRSRLSLFNQLVGADTKPVGYLGTLSDRFGIYGGNPIARRRKYKIIRLLFTNRRPFIFHQQNNPGDSGLEVVRSIDSFLAGNRR